MDVLAADLEQSERENFHIGFKLVRGGYMVQVDEYLTRKLL